MRIKDMITQDEFAWYTLLTALYQLNQPVVGKVQCLLSRFPWQPTHFLLQWHMPSVKFYPYSPLPEPNSLLQLESEALKHWHSIELSNSLICEQCKTLEPYCPTTIIAIIVIIIILGSRYWESSLNQLFTSICWIGDGR